MIRSMLEEKKDAVMTIVANLDKARAELFAWSQHQGSGWNVTELQSRGKLCPTWRDISNRVVLGACKKVIMNSPGPRPMLLASYGGGEVQVKKEYGSAPNGGWDNGSWIWS